MSVRMPVWVFLILFASVAAAADRYVEEGVFVSESEPPLRVKVDDRFEYLGAIRFPLKGVADVERHHWVRAENGRVLTIVILQFEGYKEGVEGRYRFQIPPPEGQAGSNYRFSPERVRLADHAFVHNTWAYDNAASIRDNPESEPAHTVRLLTDHGLSLAGELIMSRFVTEIGEAARSELIVFYMEPLSAHGKSLADFPDDGPASADYDALSELLTERSLDAMTWQAQQRKD